MSNQLPIETKREHFVRLVELEQRYGDHGHQPALWKAVADDLELSLEERLWLSILVVGYSHDGSTWVAYNMPGVQTRWTLPPEHLKIAILRRNLFGGRITKHFNEIPRDLTDWISRYRSWNGLIYLFSTLYGNGTWASYTTAETVLTVCGDRILGMDGQPIRADVGGFAANTGPRATLLDLGYEPTEAGATSLLQMVQSHGVDIPIFLLETVMCYWQNMRKGKFYVGRSIDRQQNQIEYAEQKHVCCSRLWAARSKIFNIDTLGEIQGWPGLDKERLKHYLKTTEILLPTEQRIRKP